MNEMPEAEAPMMGKKAAVILGTVFLLVYALFAWWLQDDRSNRARLETLTPHPLPAVEWPTPLPPEAEESSEPS